MRRNRNGILRDSAAAGALLIGGKLSLAFSGVFGYGLVKT